MSKQNGKSEEPSVLDMECLQVDQLVTKKIPEK
jgi:hypothetical protein